MIKNARFILFLKVLILITAFVGINPYALLFTVPTYLGTSLLLWLSNMSRKEKLKWTILPAFCSILIIIIGTAVIYIFKIN